MIDSPATKKCPYCAEQILAEAIKCRFCGSDVRVVLITVPEQLSVGLHHELPYPIAQPQLPNSVTSPVAVNSVITLPQDHWIALGLNALFFPTLGSGYVYLGYWGRFLIAAIGAPMFIGMVTGIFPLCGILLSFALWVATVIDAYNLPRRSPYTWRNVFSVWALIVGLCAVFLGILIVYMIVVGLYPRYCFIDLGPMWINLCLN